MKKRLIFALIATIAVMATVLPASVRAEENNTVTARVLNYNSNTLYHVFDAPTDILASENGIYVKTASGYELYQKGDIFPCEISADELAYISGLIYLQNGSIHYSDNVISGNYSAISAYENTLYALDGNRIDKFSYIDGMLTENGSFTAKTEVRQIAATQSGCVYFSPDEYGYSYTIYEYESAKPFATVYEEILDIDYSDKIFVLTQSKVIAYVDRYSKLEYSFPVANAKRMSASDKVYVLTAADSIESITLDLAKADTVIASSGNKDWFYLSPMNGNSRLGKIYIADRDLNRVAVIDGSSVKYIENVGAPIAVAADNAGNVYVAHYGNRVACFKEYKLIDEYIFDEDIVDINVNSDNELFLLTENNTVIDKDGSIIRQGVNAFDFQNGWHYLTDEYMDDVPVDGASDVCVDIAGNLFAVSGNTIIAYVDNEIVEYTVETAIDLCSVIISKADNSIISYGDLILIDRALKTALVVNGGDVGSVNVKDLFTPPELTNSANELSEGIIAETSVETYLFTLPIEGEISYVAAKGENLIVCPDIFAPDPFVYCICDTADNTLVKGYVYKDSISHLPYSAPEHSEAKINANNTPVYKYPSVHSPKISSYQKEQMITILPFVVNFRDDYYTGWYVDVYGNRWYRIAYGEGEGFVLTADTNVRFFSEAELPKTNATVIENAILYRYDENTGKYVEFEAAGTYIAKDTRVVVELPFDTSREYTKIVFYREGYGTIDADCYVRTEFIKFDGVDIVKIIAFTVIVVALITLICVIARRRAVSRRSNKNQPEA